MKRQVLFSIIILFCSSVGADQKDILIYQVGRAIEKNNLPKIKLLLSNTKFSREDLENFLDLAQLNIVKKQDSSCSNLLLQSIPEAILTGVATTIMYNLRQEIKLRQKTKNELKHKELAFAAFGSAALVFGSRTLQSIAQIIKDRYARKKYLEQALVIKHEIEARLA